MEDIIHWVTEHKDESPPKRKVNHSTRTRLPMKPSEM